MARRRRTEIESHIIPSRRLMTIGPSSPAWRGGEFTIAVDIIKLIEGAIVRLMPSSDATDARIEELRAMLEAHNAAAVKILPRAVIGTIGDSDDNAVINSNLEIRQVVRNVATRMASVDQVALIAELDSAMDEAGL